jgi:hypothetical protein
VPRLARDRAFPVTLTDLELAKSTSRFIPLISYKNFFEPLDTHFTNQITARINMLRAKLAKRFYPLLAYKKAINLGNALAN